jgi:hypothetical protein
MPYQIDFDAAMGRAVVTWAGSVRFDDTMLFVEALLQLADPPLPRLDVLHDFRNAQWRISEAELTGLAKGAMRVGERLGPGKVAFVAPDDLTFGMSRMHEIVAGGSPREMATFRDLSAAHAWLGWDAAD